MKILFFIESLRCGGKERRLLELVRYLNQHTDFEMLLVLTEDEIHYRYVYDLDIQIRIIKRKGIRKDPRLFIKFFRMCNEFKPDIIHTWGSMLAIYAMPVTLVKNIPHINGHIADAPLSFRKFDFHGLITKLGFRFSDIVLANSQAGLRSYSVSGEKCRVIYNGIRLDRFTDLQDSDTIRSQFNLTASYTVVMLASFTTNKNYDQFLDVAEIFMRIRNDTTFLGVGDTEEDAAEFRRIKKRAEKLDNVILSEKIDNSESLVNACDIGVLFTHGEGISNSIIEYMACAKPVISNDAGGTREIIRDNVNGFLIAHQTNEQIAVLIDQLLNDRDRRLAMGRNGRLGIEKEFTVERMGDEFLSLYHEVKHQ